MLTSSDSRESPSWVFDTTPGELFVIRNAGNTAFTEAIASIEYGVSVLKTPLLMVMGHSRCGAVKAAMEVNPLPPALDRLIQPIREYIIGCSDLEDAVQRDALGRIDAAVADAEAVVEAGSEAEAAEAELRGVPEKYLTAAETMFGPYAWGRFDVVVMPRAFARSSVAHPNLTFLAPSVIVGDGSLAYTVAHEVAANYVLSLIHI